MLKSLDFDLENELSLVIGKNNCGKTSLLSALDKFIGSQSSLNNFTFDDFNSDFQDNLFAAVDDCGKSWSSLAIKGIEMFIYIEYDESDNLSNIQPLMLDLDPNNNIVILKLEYTLSDQKFNQLLDDFSAYNTKYENAQGYKKKKFLMSLSRQNTENIFQFSKKQFCMMLVPISPLQRNIPYLTRKMLI